eukprot:5615590-Pleurochrysis_carterae.AAC.1
MAVMESGAARRTARRIVADSSEDESASVGHESQQSPPGVGACSTAYFCRHSTIGCQHSISTPLVAQGQPSRALQQATQQSSLHRAPASQLFDLAD